MKKVIAIVSFLAVANMAFAAGYQLNWSNPWGMYTHDATDMTAESGYILEQYDVLWQLIYAGPNNAIDEIDLSNENFLGGDDQILGTRIYNKGSAVDLISNNEWDDLGLFTIDNSITVTAENELQVTVDGDTRGLIVGDYLYQRVFEAKTPVEGTYYYETSLVAIDSSYAGGSQTFPLNDNYDAGIKPTLQVQGSGNVPEPATMSLLGLGALAMVLRRKLRK